MSAWRVISSDSLRLHIATTCLAAVSLFIATSTVAVAETQGYVIQWIHTATYPQKDNCPQGGNGGRLDIQRRILLREGYTQAQASKILHGYDPAAANNGNVNKIDFNKIGTLFGRRDVNVLNFPTSIPDPHIQTAQGRFMYGFNLAGKSESYAFEDPDTHEMVEDQMWRVLGCFDEYHIPLTIIPYNEAIGWDTEEDAMPAWVLSISGADLNKDGDVTVFFDRALTVVSRNAYGGALQGASYTIDPDPRSHNVFRGHIKDGVVTIEPGNFYLLGELPKFYPVLRFSQAHLRLKLNPDQSSLHYGGKGVVSGLIGGYQPWMDYFRYLAVRDIDNVDTAGIYYAMKRLADGAPDPLTGENTAISAVYYFEAVPVFLTKERAPIVAGATTSARTEVPKAPATTPQGVTIIEVARELNLSEPQLLWLRPGDANGRTLFVYDKDGTNASNCDAVCSEQFLPLPAPVGSKAFGDWSLVRRRDGSRQWAYQSHPLYTWAKEKNPGEVATNVGLTETVNLKIAETPAEIGSLLPPAGWHDARFAFGASVAVPNGIEVRLVPSAQAVVLVNSNGLTLYTFDGNAKRDHQRCAVIGCESQWIPVSAPEIASEVGDFSIVIRSDGSNQWAYRKRPLYLYRADKLPGDAHGIGIDKKWDVAVVSEDFRPRGVSVTSLDGYGDVLSVNGMTLYGGHPFESRNGGRSLHASFANLYTKDKRLGVAGCTDAVCLKTWHPFLAPTDAHSVGFWEPIERPDGTKQWAYKGCALYTYVGDKVPGDHNGQGLNDFAKIDGSAADLRKALYFVGFGPRTTGGLGVYWNVAKP